MGSTITLGELLPFAGRIRKLLTGSELLFVYELDKYVKLMLDKRLDLTDISILAELKRERHFSFVSTNGLEFDFVPKKEDLADYSSDVRKYFLGTVEGVVFKEETPEKVVFEYYHDVDANRVFRDDHSSMAYISLVAYLIVRSYQQGVPVPKLFIDHGNYNQQELEYADLFILKMYGNRFLEDLVEIEYSENWGYQPEWEAYVMERRQRGHMNNPDYTMRDKFTHLRRNFAVGDVVLYYQRSKPAKGKTINRLTACYPAVIRYFDKTTVVLEYFPIVQTRLTRRMELEEISSNFEEMGKESIYTEDDYERFISTTNTYTLTEIGVGDCTYVEREFFIEPIDFDGTYQYLEIPDGVQCVWLSTLDTIYAVFEDRGVDYDKERFLQKYFKNREPVYEQYKREVEEHKAAKEAARAQAQMQESQEDISEEVVQ